MVYLQTTDELQISLTGNSWQAQLTRRMGIGSDARKPMSFNAILVDFLPIGIHLLSPQPGSMQITALDGKEHPMNISTQQEPNGTNLTLAFRDLPTLPTGEQCCDCSGDCDRACSAEFSYITNACYTPGQWGTLRIESSVKSITVGKATAVRLMLQAMSKSLDDPTLVVTFPAEVNGAKIVVKGYSPVLHSIQSPSKLTCLTIQHAFTGGVVYIDLDITPTKVGNLHLEGLAEIDGQLSKPIRSVPRVTNASIVNSTQITHISIRESLDICVR
jgi:hypothetical protein